MDKKLFLNPAGHGYVDDNKRHLWVLEQESRGRRNEYTPVCGSVSPVRGNANFQQAFPGEWSGEDVCDECRNTDEFETYKEQTLNISSTTEQDSDRNSPTTTTDTQQTESDTDSDPFDSLDEGKVLVNRNYVGEAPTSRKLHAYKREKTDRGVLYRAYCGQDVIRTPDPLEPMGAKIFTGRGSTCKTCSEQVDPSLDTGDASQVSYDPFGVFDTVPAPTGAPPDLTLDDIPPEPDEYQCDQCGRTFGSKGLGQHWGHPNSTCDYPEPSDYEKELLIGLWLAGGAIETRGTHPVMRKTSTNRLALEWLRDELGVWATDVSESQSAEQQSSNVETGFGYEGADSQTQYRITTRACPFLDSLQNRNVLTLPFTSTIARVVYSFRGSLHDKSAVSIRHKEADLLAHVFHDVGFTETSVYEPEDGKNQYTLVLSAEDSREFAEWVEAPLPGFDNKAFEFREKGAQGVKPSRRVEPFKEDGEPTASEPMESTADEEDESELPDTISLEPDWEWVGAQLYKLGMRQMALRAFNADLSPAEVYGEGGVQDLIYDEYQNTDASLDLGAPFEGALSTVEKPVDKQELAEIKRDLGLHTNSPSDGDGGSGNATA